MEHEQKRPEKHEEEWTQKQAEARPTRRRAFSILAAGSGHFRHLHISACPQVLPADRCVSSDTPTRAFDYSPARHYPLTINVGDEPAMLAVGGCLFGLLLMPWTCRFGIALTL